jgi:epoxide hydrolase-like predicted phosphatase
MANLDSVIFDWGGVLIEDPGPGIIVYCSRALGVNEKACVAAVRKYQRGFQKGLVGEDTFWRLVCGELCVPPPKTLSLWKEAFTFAYKTRAQVFAIAKALKGRGMKLALLSNTEAPAMGFAQLAEYVIFDSLVFSCSEGCVKPDSRIYELSVEKLETTPDRAIFVDDRPDYIEGAHNAGLHTILFESADRLNAELVRLLST